MIEKFITEKVEEMKQKKIDDLMTRIEKRKKYLGTQLINGFVVDESGNLIAEEKEISDKEKEEIFLLGLQKQNQSDTNFINSCDKVLKKNEEEIAEITELFFKRFGRRIEE